MFLELNLYLFINSFFMNFEQVMYLSGICLNNKSNKIIILSFIVYIYNGLIRIMYCANQIKFP